MYPTLDGTSPSCTIACRKSKSRSSSQINIHIIVHHTSTVLHSVPRVYSTVFWAIADIRSGSLRRDQVQPYDESAKQSEISMPRRAYTCGAQAFHRIHKSSLHLGTAHCGWRHEVVQLSAISETGRPTFFFATFSARLSKPTFNSSVMRRSYGARPATSRTISRTNFTRLLARCAQQCRAPVSNAPGRAPSIETFQAHRITLS